MSIDAPLAAPRSDAGSATVLVVEGVGYAVEGRRILEPVSLAFSAGRVAALIGHNGSGKSTLMKILARQVMPSEGRVLLDGRPLGAWGARTLARRLAYLPQQAAEAGMLTVRELVALGRYPWHGALGRFGAGDAAKVEDALAATGLTGLTERLVGTLSGGERQRAFIAMLVAQDAGVLLLDEPTSALDVAHQLEVLGLVRRLARERGLAVVLVLHDVNMAARFSDDIVALSGGRRILAGPPEALMTPEALARVTGVGMDVIRHPATGLPVGVPR